MGKLIVWNVMSLDGSFEGAAPWDLRMHDLVWGPELEALSKETLAGAHAILFGRATYEGMYDYWRKEEGVIADGMNSVAKAVVSTTLKSADWNNSRLLRSIEDVKALKADGGDKPVYVFGSARLVSSLRQADLVDEYRLCVSPILMGEGTPMFKPGDRVQRLSLIEARPIVGGGVILRYEPAR
jgi:dihydrofolate reductase